MELIRRLLWTYHLRSLDKRERQQVAEMRRKLHMNLTEPETILLMEQFESLDSVRRLRGAPSLMKEFYGEYAPRVRHSSEWPVVLLDEGGKPCSRD